MEQPLTAHLREVGEIAARLTAKLGIADAGQLMGLVHDFGKFGREFQTYLGSATGKINPDEDEYVDFGALKGKIDHSTAGAQWVWQRCRRWGSKGELVGQVLSLCIASHHSGLIDCLAPDGVNTFIRRMSKADDRTHKNECSDNAPKEYIASVEALLGSGLVEQMVAHMRRVTLKEGAALPLLARYFNLGLLTRMLFSCLIDADRINSADFEYSDNAQHRSSERPDWSVPVGRLEEHIDKLPGTGPIDGLRRDISSICKKRAKGSQGIYTLTVPTGGGKTYASLRYALHHAEHHHLDRVFFIIPFTSIIEQNAAALRKAIEKKGDKRPWILESHSNLEPEQQTWQSKLVSQNWDAPIVMTTMVQFLEVLFSGGTRGARKMHQLARSVVVFDEIQTLPIKCTHLFCNALNFLTDHCETTAVLCTATQPLLNRLRNPKNGQLNIQSENELVSDVPQLFLDLKRVHIHNCVRAQGWTAEEVAELAADEQQEKGSCLVIVNTKAWAVDIYNILESRFAGDTLYLLSTSLCPVHRKTILDVVRQRLEKKEPVLCVSTQLMEAGVDVDFGAVVRFLAGLDSIAQAAGRCNRHGRSQLGTVHVVNPKDENLSLLKDIEAGRDKARRMLDDGCDDLLAPGSIEKYFEYYFHDRASEMVYPITGKERVRDDDLLSMLSCNHRNTGQAAGSLLQQSFMSAAREFRSIDTPAQAIVVPYGAEGRRLVAELCGVAKEFDVKRYRTLLRQAQQFSVNVFPHRWKRLAGEGAIREIQEGAGIYTLDERFYSEKFGVSDKPCSPMVHLHG